MTFPDDWAKKSRLTVPAAQVGSGGVASFTALFTAVSLSASTRTRLFNEAKSDGSDLRISVNADGSGLCTVDVISFDASAKSFVIRAGPLSLSSSSDNTLYLWWGNAAASAQTGSDAYDANWAGYWPDGGGVDRTVNANHGTGSGGVVLGGVTGKVGNAMDYDGVDDYSDIATGRLISDLADASFLGWMQPDTLSNGSNGGTIYGERPPTGNDIWEVAFDNNNAAGDAVGIVHRNTAGALSRDGQDTAMIAAEIAVGAWRHFGLSKSGTTVSWFSDGAADGSHVLAGDDVLTSGTTQVRIGQVVPAVAAYFDGVLNELQAHSTDRDLAWITTEFNQSNNPASFMSSGNPESAAAAATTRVYAI